MLSIKLIAAFVGLAVTFASASRRIPRAASSIIPFHSPLATEAADHSEPGDPIKRDCSVITLYGGQDYLLSTKCNVVQTACTPCVGCEANQCAEKRVPTGLEASPATVTAVMKIIPTLVEAVTTVTAAEKVVQTPVV